MLNSRYTQTYTTLNSKLNTQIHLYIHDSLQSSTVRSVQGQQGLFLFPGRDRGWWLTVIDSWVFGLGCHLWGFTIGKAFIHIQQRTLVRYLSHRLIVSEHTTQTHTDRVCWHTPSILHTDTHTQRVCEHISSTYLMFIPQGNQSETVETLCQREEGSGSLGGIHLHLETVMEYFRKLLLFLYVSFGLVVFPSFFMGLVGKKKYYITYSHVA